MPSQFVTFLTHFRCPNGWCYSLEIFGFFLFTLIDLWHWISCAYLYSMAGTLDVRLCFDWAWYPRHQANSLESIWGGSPAMLAYSLWFSFRTQFFSRQLFPNMRRSAVCRISDSFQFLGHWNFPKWFPSCPKDHFESLPFPQYRFSSDLTIYILSGCVSCSCPPNHSNGLLSFVLRFWANLNKNSTLGWTVSHSVTPWNWKIWVVPDTWNEHHPARRQYFANPNIPRMMQTKGS